MFFDLPLVYPAPASGSKESAAAERRSRPMLRVDGARDPFVGVADDLRAELAAHALFVEPGRRKVTEVMEVEPLRARGVYGWEPFASDLKQFPPRPKSFTVSHLGELESFAGYRWAERVFRENGRAFYVFIGVGARDTWQLPTLLKALDSLRLT